MDMGIFDLFKKRDKPEVPGFRYTPVLRNYDSFKDIVVHWNLSGLKMLYRKKYEEESAE